MEANSRQKRKERLTWKSTASSKDGSPLSARSFNIGRSSARVAALPPSFDSVSPPALDGDDDSVRTASVSTSEKVGVLSLREGEEVPPTLSLSTSGASNPEVFSSASDVARTALSRLGVPQRQNARSHPTKKLISY